jgi:hypothetical protein
MSRPGRPRSDRLVLLERIAPLFRDEPDIAANEVLRRVPGRRRDVLRIVKALKAAKGRESG